MKVFKLFIAVSCFFVASSAFAAGFSVGSQGAGQYGKAAAAVASVDDASANFFNPAALVKLKGTQAYIGTSIIKIGASFTQDVDGKPVLTESTGGLVIIPHIHLSHRLDEDTAIGLGIFIPFGAAAAWPNDHPQSDIAIEQALKAGYISPTVAFNIGESFPGLRVSGSLDFVPAQFSMRRNVRFGSDYASLEADAAAFGWGARVGLLYDSEDYENVHIGLTYRTPVNLSFTGTADFDGEPEYRGAMPPDGDASFEFVLPAALIAGLAYDWDENLSIELNAEWMEYSSYEKVDIQWADGTHSVAAKNWKDSVALRFGVTYDADIVKLRAGYEFNTTPVPLSTIDASLPGINRNYASMGLGFDLPADFVFDIAGAYMYTLGRSSSLVDYAPKYKADYELNAIIIVCSVGRTFGGGE